MKPACFVPILTRLFFKKKMFPLKKKVPKETQEIGGENVEKHRNIYFYQDKISVQLF